MKKIIVLIPIFLLSLMTISTSAEVINGNFETGDFTGWETIGNATIVDEGYGTNVYNGNFQALLRTNGGAPKNELLEFVGAWPSSWFWTQPIIEGSAIKTTIQLEDFQSFKFVSKFLTNVAEEVEVGGDYGLAYFIFIKSSGGGGTSLIGNNFRPYRGNIPLISSYTEFQFEQESWFSSQRDIYEPLTITFSVFVADFGNSTEGHGLLIDELETFFNTPRLIENAR